MITSFRSQLIVSFCIFTHSLCFSLSANMGWSSTWDDILKKGGNPRWKVDDLNAKKIALDHIQSHAVTTNKKDDVLSIFCPLAGDDPFIRYAWGHGHDVTALDIVPEAVEAMRSQFDGSWEKKKLDNGTVVWIHDSGRATLYQGDALVQRTELYNKFNAVYDKDSFGALEKSMRSTFCQRIADYTKKEGSIVYVEVKKKADNHPQRDSGPPFSVSPDDLMETTNFGLAFEYMSNLGKVYDLPIPGMTQTGHILRRIVRR